jgi:hypothetical protein
MQAFAELVFLVLGAVAVVGSGVIVALIAMQEHGARRPRATVTRIGRRLPSAA